MAGRPHFCNCSHQCSILSRSWLELGLRLVLVYIVPYAFLIYSTLKFLNHVHVAGKGAKAY